MFSLNSVTKIFVIIVKGSNLQPLVLETRHMWETESLNLLQFMLQWFIRFPEFSEFIEFLFHLGKTLIIIQPAQQFAMSNFGSSISGITDFVTSKCLLLKVINMDKCLPCLILRTNCIEILNKASVRFVMVRSHCPTPTQTLILRPMNCNSTQWHCCLSAVWTTSDNSVQPIFCRVLCRAVWTLHKEPWSNWKFKC